MTLLINLSSSSIVVIMPYPLILLNIHVMTLQSERQVMKFKALPTVAWANLTSLPLTLLKRLWQNKLLSLIIYPIYLNRY